jgi:hypothetical protein
MPYRAPAAVETAALPARVELPSPVPRRIRVLRPRRAILRLVVRDRAFVGAALLLVPSLLAFILFAGACLLSGLDRVAQDGPYMVLVGILPTGFAVWTWRTVFGGERLEIGLAGLLQRRGLLRRSAFALHEISTVVVAGDPAQLQLQLGRRTVELAAGRGHDEAALRWLAQALRAGLDAARASR